MTGFCISLESLLGGRCINLVKKLNVIKTELGQTLLIQDEKIRYKEIQGECKHRCGESVLNQCQCLCCQ